MVAYAYGGILYSNTSEITTTTNNKVGNYLNYIERSRIHIYYTFDSMYVKSQIS